ncbi:hypothetical protein SSX86_022842 [Deinandra increscens subsp. villosa]|uniref:Integrase catalytic domain-containing protein n=1 Tax=Deinandra increscens subsp. villosa TaxID=3103831 RepID=A0AAP0GRJ3_9ASTR
MVGGKWPLSFDAVEGLAGSIDQKFQGLWRDCKVRGWIEVSSMEEDANKGQGQVSIFLKGLRLDIGCPVRLFMPKTLKQSFQLARMQDSANVVLGVKSQSPRYFSTPSTSISVVKIPTPLATFRSPSNASKLLLLPTPPVTQKLNSTKRLTRKEIEDKRSKGECFWCTEKFSQTHKCPNKQLYTLEVVDGDEGDQNEVVTEPNEPQISIHAIMGSTSFSTMRVLANNLGCPLQEVPNMKVSVANGDKLNCAKMGGLLSHSTQLVEGLLLSMRLDSMRDQFSHSTVVKQVSHEESLMVSVGLPSQRSFDHKIQLQDESMVHWHHYLSLGHFIIRTDQKSLKHLMAQKISTPLQHVWLSKLMPYDFEIVYKQDEKLKTIVQSLEAGTSVKNYGWKNETSYKHNKITVGKVPELQQDIISLCHSTHMGGHLGVSATSQRKKSLFKWKGLSRHVREFIRQCLVCQRAKYENVAMPGFLQPLPVPSHIFSDISMDFVGGMPKFKNRGTIFVMVDILTKYAHFMSLSHPYLAAQGAQLFLDNIFKLHGWPDTIISDMDLIFISSFWKELIRLQGVSLALSTAYHPQTDGQTEVMNMCLELYLRCMSKYNPSKWENWLSLVAWWYNTSFHTSIHMTPFQALDGFPHPLFSPYVPKDTRVEAVDKLLTDREEMVQSTLRKRKFSKLFLKFYGPFLIFEKIVQVAYRRDLPSDSQIHSTFHVSLLKQAQGPPVDIIPLPKEPRFQLQPAKVLDTKVYKKKNHIGAKWLVQWKDLPIVEAT